MPSKINISLTLANIILAGVIVSYLPVSPLVQFILGGAAGVAVALYGAFDFWIIVETKEDK
jgi:hypothetical protein